MKIKYQAQKGYRIKNHDFIGLEVYASECHWYREDLRQWRTIDDVHKDLPPNTWYSSAAPCRSLRAAIRKIKKYDLPKGTKFRLVSIWVGHDIEITK